MHVVGLISSFIEYRVLMKVSRVIMVSFSFSFRHPWCLWHHRRLFNYMFLYIIVILSFSNFTIFYVPSAWLHSHGLAILLPFNSVIPVGGNGTYKCANKIKPSLLPIVQIRSNPTYFLSPLKTDRLVVVARDYYS